jgi:hypothetical protein
LHVIHQCNTSQHLQILIKFYIFCWKVLQFWPSIIGYVKYSVGHYTPSPSLPNMVLGNCIGCFLFCACFFILRKQLGYESFFSNCNKNKQDFKKIKLAFKTRSSNTHTNTLLNWTHSLHYNSSIKFTKEIQRLIHSLYIHFAHLILT